MGTAADIPPTFAIDGKPVTTDELTRMVASVTSREQLIAHLSAALARLETIRYIAETGDEHFQSTEALLKAVSTVSKAPLTIPKL